MALWYLCLSVLSSCCTVHKWRLFVRGSSYKGLCLISLHGFPSDPLQTAHASKLIAMYLGDMDRGCMFKDG